MAAARAARTIVVALAGLTLPAGSVGVNYNFGEMKASSIGGCAYVDNQHGGWGSWSTGDTGVCGEKVKLAIDTAEPPPDDAGLLAEALLPLTAEPPPHAASASTRKAFVVKICREAPSTPSTVVSSPSVRSV